MHASTYALGVPSEYPESSGLDGRESSTMPLQYHFSIIFVLSNVLHHASITSNVAPSFLWESLHPLRPKMVVIVDHVLSV